MNVGVFTHLNLLCWLYRYRVCVFDPWSSGLEFPQQTLVLRAVINIYSGLCCPLWL